jgi:hypothetical protein
MEDPEESGSPKSAGQRFSVSSKALLAEVAPSCSRVEMVGSMRLGKNDGTLKLLVWPPGGDEAAVSGKFPSFSISRGPGPRIFRGIWKPLKGRRDIPVEIVIADPDRWGVLELFHTGPPEFVKIVEEKARREGMTFVWKRGLCVRETNVTQYETVLDEVSFPSECALFHAIGMDFIPPLERIAFCRPSKRKAHKHRGGRQRKGAWLG